MPRPPFWVFSLTGFLLFFFFSWLNELLETFCPPFLFLSLMIFGHFDAISRLLSCLDALAPFCAWWIFPFLMKSLLDESCIPLDMMNFRLFKLDAHFFFLSHWWNFISLSLIEWNLIFLRWSPIFNLMNSLLVFHVF